MDSMVADFSPLSWFLWSGFLSAVAASTWVEHTGSCYLVRDSNTQKSTAEVTCTSLGGALTEIESPGEYLAVNEVLQGHTIEAWVGLRRVTPGGAFQWSRAGTQPDAEMWKAEEPNNTGDCVRLVRYFNDTNYVVTDLGSFQLADHPCYMMYRPFCEKPASPHVSRSERLSVLPGKLCPVASYITSGLLECAQVCARQLTSCYVYSHQEAGGVCTFHRLSSNCVNYATHQPGPHTTGLPGIALSA